MRVFVGVVLCALALAGCGGGGSSTPFGLDARVTASGLNIPIEPPSGSSTQARAVVAFPGIRIPGPTFFTGSGDNSRRFFVTDRNGVITVFDNRADVQSTSVFMDLSSRVDDSTGENGMLGLVFDPDFSSNRYFYVSYVYVPDSSNPNPSARTVRVSRFQANAALTAASASSERVVLEYAHPVGEHFGGWIGFGPETDRRTLYISAGDGGNETLVENTSSFFGKILRIRLNLNADCSNKNCYSIPGDNPFGTEVWSMGFRNPWRCSFDRIGNGNLWCGDVGQSNFEEINLVKRGANHGWPYFEGNQRYGTHSRNPADFEPPVYAYPHSVGVAVIGGYVYRGNLMPGLRGRYLYTDFVNTTLWSLQADGTNEVAAPSFAGQDRYVYTMGQDDVGEVYAVNDQGVIYRFEAGSGGGPGGPTMPSTLSATGLFDSTAALTPKPFLIDYTVNAPFWSDGAGKKRWFVLPGTQTITFSADGAWSFPVGTITVKHFELPNAGGGNTRLETRVMVHRTDGWVGFSYRWRADESDADLVPEGGASGTYGTQTWAFPSRAQCLQCHTAATGRVLGLNTRQFNGNHTYAATSLSDNQLRALNHIGIFSADIGTSSQYGAMPDPRNASVPLQDRAKAYLDTNCSVCHRPGGPTPVNMDLRYDTALSAMNIVGVAAAQAGLQRVAPGNPAGSDIVRRTSSSDASVRMPPLGVQVVDEEAVQLLSAWITGVQ
jgi:uncharacterized repeat protein (TIGR03806 family)